MTIIRCVYDDDHPPVYVVRATAQNKALSYEALGMLTYLLSQADDWVVGVDDLIREACGRDKAYRILKELSEAGHLAHVRVGVGQKKPPVWAERTVYEQPYTPSTKSVKAGFGEPISPIPEMPDLANTSENPPNPEKADYAKSSLTDVHAGAVKQILKSQKTQEQEQGLKDKNISHTLTTAPARPRFTTALYAGQDVYADGHFISPEDEFRQFLTMCNAIFDAWLGALKTLKRAPMLSDESLWEQNREAAVSLAKFRADPADVKAFVLAQYKAKDPFWRNLKSPMKLSAVANGLASWKVSPVEETVAASTNGKHDARAAPASTPSANPPLHRAGVLPELRSGLEHKT